MNKKEKKPSREMVPVELSMITEDGKLIVTSPDLEGFEKTYQLCEDNAFNMSQSLKHALSWHFSMRGRSEIDRVLFPVAVGNDFRAGARDIHSACLFRAFVVLKPYCRPDPAAAQFQPKCPVLNFRT